MKDAPLDDLLCAALLKVRARAAGLLPSFWGTLVQGAWLGWVSQSDPALAEHLHAENQERPFTCSALWLPEREEQTRLQEAGQRIAVRAGQVCWLRLTLLDGVVFGAFADRALATSEGGAVQPTLTLNGIPFDLLELVMDERAGARAAGETGRTRRGQAPAAVGAGAGAGGERSWSGWTSYAALVEQSQQRARRRLERLTLEFDTPTAFTGEHQPWGRETLLLPEPLRVFGGLARRWQRFAPPGLAEAIEPEALSRYLEERARVDEYALHTQRLHLRQALVRGFVGRCAYHLPPDDADDRLRRQAHLLADFAFYAGVGHKTAQGMGRARRLEGER